MKMGTPPCLPLIPDTSPQHHPLSYNNIIIDPLDKQEAGRAIIAQPKSM
jgi:hypothetical protein